MYDTLRFFGTVPQFLAFTRNLHASELLDKEHSKNVKTYDKRIEGFGLTHEDRSLGVEVDGKNY